MFFEHQSTKPNVGAPLFESVLNHDLVWQNAWEGKLVRKYSGEQVGNLPYHHGEQVSYPQVAATPSPPHLAPPLWELK